MTDINKAIKPVESLTIAPLNEGSQFKANNYIQFRIGASDLNMWLVNNSYLKFDLAYTRAGFTPTGNSVASKPFTKTYIRNANNIFRSIEVLYGGDTIYSQPYNIEQNVIKQLSYGESYMEANFATFTTVKMIENGLAYLELDNGSSGETGHTADAVAAASEKVINDIMIPVNQLVPIFMDLTSNGFPVKNLKSQLEFRLYIAEPYRYLVDYRPGTSTKPADFSDTLYCGDASSDYVDITMNGTNEIKTRYPANNIELRRVKMYCSHYIAEQNESAVIDDKINSSGMKLRYQMVHTALRQMNGIQLGNNNLPFTVATQNVKSMMLYCHKQDVSPSLMYRPYINSLYIKFGSNQLPFQPIAGDSLTTPHEFKFTSDDVLNNLDTYYSETNDDFNRSYRYNDAVSTKTVDSKQYRADLSVPESTFVMMGANYTSDPTDLGSNSSRWNSQYQATFMANIGDATRLTYVLAITSDYGCIIKDGDIKCINL